MTGKVRVVIVHGWMGTPSRDWLAWVGKALKRDGIAVEIPKMPNTNKPKIEEWTRHLKKLIRKPDEKLFLVGHSIGGRQVLRYLETIDQKIGGAIIVASWLDKRRIDFSKKENAIMMAPWLDTPINWKLIKQHSKSFTAIYSDNDRYVPLEAGRIIRKRLGARLVVLKNKGHIDQITSPQILKEIRLLLMQAQKD